MHVTLLVKLIIILTSCVTNIIIFLPRVSYSLRCKEKIYFNITTQTKNCDRFNRKLVFCFYSEVKLFNDACKHQQCL